MYMSFLLGILFPRIYPKKIIKDAYLRVWYNNEKLSEQSKLQ